MTTDPEKPQQEGQPVETASDETDPPTGESAPTEPAADVTRPADASGDVDPSLESAQTVADAGPAEPTPADEAPDPDDQPAPAATAEGSPPPMSPAPMPDLAPSPSRAGASAAAASIDLLRDVELNVKIELGRAKMLVEDVLTLAAGSVVELDKLAGDPVDIYVNERLVARGEVLILNDNFCVRVSQILADSV